MDLLSNNLDKSIKNDSIIAITGSISSGKSMIISALLGSEIATAIPTPEAESLIRYRRSLDGDYVKVSFYTTLEWTLLWECLLESSIGLNREDYEYFLDEYNELNADSNKDEFLNKKAIIIKTHSVGEMEEIVDRYTSVRFPEHYFIKEVEIGLSDCFLAPNVIIVDIPIRNPLSYKTAMNLYLRKANVILICKRSSYAMIRNDELVQLTGLFSEPRHYKDRIYIVGTQIDVQSNMQSYWESYTLPEYIKYFKSKAFFGSEETAMNHIVPASAWYFLCATKAYENPELWKEKGMQKTLREMIRRLYDYVPLEELIEEYGEEEAYKRFMSPKKIFELNYDDILKRTRIPKLNSIIRSHEQFADTI